MIFGGIQKLTLIDYPGTVAATVFTVGCNFTCPFCHNPELVDGRLSSSQPKIDQADILRFFKIRSGILEGVCVTGGEPTLYPDLPDFVRELKNMGFKVKLDTNGTNPVMVEKMLDENLLDYIAMDMKAPLNNKHKEVCGKEVELETLQNSIKLIINSGIEHEFRTTVIPGVLDNKDIEAIVRSISGAKKYALQQFVPKIAGDEKLRELLPYTKERLLEMANIAKQYIPNTIVRGI